MSAPIDLRLPAAKVPPWMERAYCASSDMGADLWHGETTNETALARRLCRQECPVIADCLYYAITNGETAGVWGGMSPKQRKATGRRVSTCKRNHPGEPAEPAPRMNGEWRCRACERVHARKRSAA